MSGIQWAYVSLALIVTFVATWARLIRRVNVGAGLGVARVLAAAAMLTAVLALTASPGWLGGAFAGGSLSIGAIFFLLGSLSRQSHQPSAIALGRPLPAFEAPDHLGNPFRSESLRGRPMLIKFFRGHW